MSKERVVRNLQKAVKARGLTMKHLAKVAGMDPSYFSHFCNPKKSHKKLDEIARKAAAQELCLSEKDLMTDEELKSLQALKQPEGDDYHSVSPIAFLNIANKDNNITEGEQETIPLYGPVMTTINSAKPWNVKPIGHIDIIPELEMVPNGYAVRLAESLGVMPPNTILHVDPFLTEVKGALVLVRFKKAPQPGLKVKIHAFVGQFDDTYGDYYHFINESERIHAKDVVEIGYIKGAIFP